jgi:hypothetical protein
MIQVLRLSDTLEVGAMVGIDPESDGLARAKRLKIPTTHDGPPAPAPTSTSSPKPPRTPSKRWAGRHKAKRSSSSIQLSRR